MRLLEAAVAFSPETARNLLVAARNTCSGSLSSAKGVDDMSSQRAMPCAKRREAEQPREIEAAPSARVLLAEDDRELRRLLAAELRKEGYLVKEAANGFELLECLGDVALPPAGFDLIVTDIRMPGLTGLSVAEGLRSGIKPSARGIPILLITAFGDEETHAEASRLGTAILDKPFDLADFRACANSLVNP